VTKQGAKAALTIDEPRPAAPTIKAGRLMSKEDAEKVKAAIARATTIEEIRKLERSLQEGYMPEMDSVGAWYFILVMMFWWDEWWRALLLAILTDCSYIHSKDPTQKCI
jgi:hypothetical protein